MHSRGKLILQQLADQERLEYLKRPSYESTNGTTASERGKGIPFKGWPTQNPEEVLKSNRNQMVLKRQIPKRRQLTNVGFNDMNVNGSVAECASGPNENGTLEIPIETKFHLHSEETVQLTELVKPLSHSDSLSDCTQNPEEVLKSNQNQVVLKRQIPKRRQLTNVGFNDMNVNGIVAECASGSNENGNLEIQIETKSHLHSEETVQLTHLVEPLSHSDSLSYFPQKTKEVLKSNQNQVVFKGQIPKGRQLTKVGFNGMNVNSSVPECNSGSIENGTLEIQIETTSYLHSEETVQLTEWVEPLSHSDSLSHCTQNPEEVMNSNQNQVVLKRQMPKGRQLTKVGFNDMNVNSSAAECASGSNENGTLEIQIETIPQLHSEETVQLTELVEPLSHSDSISYYTNIVSAMCLGSSYLQETSTHLTPVPNVKKYSNIDPGIFELDYEPTLTEIFPMNKAPTKSNTETNSMFQLPNIDSPEFPTTIDGKTAVDYFQTDYEHYSDSSSISSEGTSDYDGFNTSNSNSLLDRPSTSTAQSFFQSTNNVSLPTLSFKENTRVYDKKNACVYCKKLFSKLPQHLERVHSDKHEVAELLSMPKGEKSRTEMLRQLRNKGNYIHNMDVLNRKDGSLIVTRRSEKDLSYTSYLPCEFCHGFFHKKKLWRHIKGCPDNGKQQKSFKQRSVVSSAFLLTPVDQCSSKLFHEQILNTMLAGPIKTLIQSDKVLCIFGSKEMEKHRYLPQLRNQISFKLRLLARLVLELRQSDPNFTVAHCVLKEHFDKVVSATSKISIEKGKPSLAKKIGHSLKKCATIFKNKCIIENHANLRKEVEDFLILFQEEWKDRISIPSTELLHRRRYEKKVDMPLPEDIIKLNKYIMTKEKDFINSNFKGVLYTEVAKVTLAHIIAFNRRRAGEVSLMEVESYKQRTTSKKPEGEIDKILSLSEKKTFSKLEIVYLRGKKGSKVDCLLTPNMVKCMEYLMLNRESYGIVRENIYMFCLPYSIHCMRGHEALKEMAEKCGASMPVHLRSTKLRRHVSTVSQLLNLTDSDFNALCKHMGHNPNVHREYYQMNEETLLKTQISKILLSLEEGNVATHRGKRLNEFDVVMDEEIQYNVFNDTPKDVMPSGDVPVNEEPLRTENQHFISENSSSSDESPNTPKLITKKSPQLKKKQGRTMWTKEEMKILNQFFTEEIMIGKRPPTKKRCEEFLSRFPQLQQNRNYLKIKWRVNSIIQENQKRREKGKKK